MWHFENCIGFLSVLERMRKTIHWMMENRATTVIWVVVIGKLISVVGLNQELNMYWPTFVLSPATLKKLHFDTELHVAPDDIENAANDFGGRRHFTPAAVLYPRSITDIQNVVKLVYMMGPYSRLTVAAKGFGHSLEGQAQAEDGIVINMQSFKGIQVHKESGKYTTPYVDVNGGELWIDVLRETLKAGLAPRSWTDYLYLTVGGTLSNAGISGQAFRYGPQISNVYHLQIVTGKGAILNCSHDHNSELFYGALGGLGQFGIITKARIALERAPQMVKWIRVLYSDFRAFTRDQEYLISKQDGHTFDYLEGFVALDKEGLLNNWRASLFTPQNPISLSTIKTKGRILYYLELTKNYNEEDRTTVEEEIRSLLEPLSFINSSVFTTDLPYMEFLDRVHAGEMKLRSKGLWEVPHPWLNLLIPKTKIAAFDKGVFKGILRNNSNGPILIYPMNRKRWDDRMSAVTPDEDIFYLVALLQSAVTADNLEFLVEQNERILSFCEKEGMGAKQYLSAHNTLDKWKKHFGSKWNKFVENKRTYDPHMILSPGQRIFPKSRTFSVL